MSDNNRITEAEYTTQTGLKITIGWVSPMVLRDHDQLWRKQYPKPRPAMRVVKIGNMQDMQPWRDEPGYIEDVAQWDNDRENYISDVMLEYGVKTDPPENWTRPAALAGLEKSDKLIWLGENLSIDDIRNLAEQISRFDKATEGAIAEEIKK